MIHNVRDFSAVGDGTSLDHKPIQEAMDRCFAEGGGTVLLPRGTYLSGALHMRSDVCLHLAAGAILKATDDPALYEDVSDAPPETERHDVRALLKADGVENVTIEGAGIIEGNGRAPLKYGERHGMFRLRILQFDNCREVFIRNIRIHYPDCWTLHFKHCENIQIRGVTILANYDRINTDGIDPDGCRNVIISDCNINVGDDCIVLKSLDGRPCENVTVTNCVLRTRCAALKLGTESFGDIRNVTFSNCVVHGTGVGIAFSCRDGGCYENILFNNIILEANREFPFFLDITPRNANSKTGDIRNVTFQNMSVTGAGRFYAMGRPGHPVRNLTLRDITWNVTGPCEVEDVGKPPGTQPHSEESAKDWTAPLQRPYQFILSHAEDVTLENVKVYDQTPEGDASCGFLYARSTNGLNVRNIKALPSPNGVPSFEIEKCGDVEVAEMGQD